MAGIDIPTEEYACFRDEFIAMLEPFASKWDERLGRTFTVKHRVDLGRSDVRLIHAVPYRAGPNACYFE